MTITLHGKPEDREAALAAIRAQYHALNTGPERSLAEIERRAKAIRRAIPRIVKPFGVVVERATTTAAPSRRANPGRARPARRTRSPRPANNADPPRLRITVDSADAIDQRYRDTDRPVLICSWCEDELRTRNKAEALDWFNDHGTKHDDCSRFAQLRTIARALHIIDQSDRRLLELERDLVRDDAIPPRRKAA